MILTNDIQYTSYDYDINKDVLIDKEEFVKAFNDDVERWTGYDYLYNFDEYGYFHGFPVYMELRVCETFSVNRKIVGLL